MAKSRCFPIVEWRKHHQFARPPNSSSRSVSGLVTGLTCSRPRPPTLRPGFFLSSESTVPLLHDLAALVCNCGARSYKRETPVVYDNDWSHSRSHYRVGGRSLRLRHASATRAFPDPAWLRKKRGRALRLSIETYYLALVEIAKLRFLL